MCRKLLCRILILLIVLHYSMGVVYELLLEDEKVFTECTGKPKGYLNMSGFWDFTDLGLEMIEEGVIVSGNMTSTWKVDPTDRIEGAVSLFYFDRGSWQQTVINMLVRDFCKSMYEENQFWQMYWTSHATNMEDVKDQCVNFGTTLTLETYLLDMKFPLDVPIRTGRYKIVVQMHAIDRAGVRRKNSICFQIRGELMKAT
ncbi:uncharacterized protein [Drosophila pseudoobscura]|uniref:Uncharacterized protein n=1 Tax=Drosophila pseudoobscura pseudoobscura TaxID=46245 RepID=A0A6I8V3A2_DROPS|nr:uncharacterized protein LOC6896947 [Drosophila pseudoobscura]